MKAMFYAVNRVEASDGDQIAAYQLWQVATRAYYRRMKELKAEDAAKRRAYCQSLRASSPRSRGDIEVLRWLRHGQTQQESRSTRPAAYASGRRQGNHSAHKVSARDHPRQP